MRNLCGWVLIHEIPSESTFSRAFAEFAESDLPGRMHKALVKEFIGDSIVGHVSRDSTATPAREKPTPKCKSDQKPMKRKRGRPRKGEERPPKDKTRLERQAAGDMTLEQMLDDLPKDCDRGAKVNAQGFRWRTHNFVDFTFIFDTLQKNSRQENSMARSDMRDFEWDFIEKLLPNKSRGVKRVDDRRVINGILYALRTGIPWRDMPEQYGPWSTIYNRFNRWSKAGIWDMIFEAIVDSHNVDTVMVDSTSVRAHPTAAKLKKTDKRRCLGRSRGGLGTKIHASNNQDGLPLKLELTPNQANDAPPCETLLTGLQPGQWVLADKAYDVNWIRDMIWEQGAIDVIPSKSNRKIPKEFDKVMYRQRNKIERFFGRLKASFRRIATRYEHTSANFLAMIKLACVRLWLEFYEYAA